MTHTFRLLVFAFLLVPFLVFAKDKKVFKAPDYRTLVTQINSSKVTLTNQSDKKKQEYTITADTTIQVNDAASTADNIKVGMQVETFRVDSSPATPPQLAELDVKEADPVEK